MEDTSIFLVLAFIGCDKLEFRGNGPRLELFARGPRVGWTVWGNQADDYTPTWDTYANHSQAEVVPLPRRKIV